MFSLKFFGGFKRQKRAFLQATEFAPRKLHPHVQARLGKLIPSLIAEDTPAELSGSIWRSSINAVRPLLIRSIITNTGSAFCVLGSVLASKAVLDHSDSLFLSLGLAFAFLCSELTDNTLNYFEMKRRAQIARGIQFHLFARINRKLLQIDPSLQGELSKGNLKTLVSSDADSVEDFITAAAANWIPTVVLLLILVPTIYSMSGRLGIIGLMIAILQIPVSVLIAQAIGRYQDKTQQQQDKLTTLVGEWVKNIRLVRYLGWQPMIEGEIKAQVRRLTIDSSLRHALVIVTYGISYSWWMAPIVGMLLAAPILGIPLVLSNFFSSIWALSYLTGYLQHIPHSISMWGNASAGAKRINHLLAAPELRRFLKPASREITGTPRTIRCNDLITEIDGKQIVSISNLVLDLTQKTAIVGEVGSGKSVLLELLCGERAPSSGKVEVELGESGWFSLWDSDVYRHYRTYVAFSPQQPFLSNTTLRKNIDLGDDLKMAAVESATAQAQLSSDLELFTRRYEEEVGETGINLSGGQKQRVSLARAFASNRPIFILDDPLSAVDRTTEKALAARIFSFAKGLVLVSHRLDELAKCERILVLRNGTIVEDGNPATLLATTDSAFNEFLRASAQPEEEVAA